MATKTTAGGFTSEIVKQINEQAYLMIHEGLLVPKLGREIGKGQKGSTVHYPYFDPTTFSNAASTLTEANDFVNYTQLTNASVILTASEFGLISFLTDTTVEGGTMDFAGEIARQQAIGVIAKYERHCLAALSAGFVTGTVTGTNSTNGFTYTHYAAAKSKIDGKILTVPGRKNAVVNEYSWFYTAKSTFSQTYAAAMGPVGDEIVKRYHINTLFNDVDVYRSNYISASITAPGYMFVKDALGIWKPRDYRLETQRDASARGDEAVSTMRGTAKVLIGSYGVRLKMYASTPTP